MAGRIVSSLVATALIAAVVSAAAPGAPSGVSATPTLKVAFNKKLKRKIVVAAHGRTLYMYTADKNGTPTCTPELDQRCARAWPPLKVTGTPTAGKGIKASLLGTVTTAHGIQVTYNKHPLYFWHGGFGLAGDRKPGQIRGQGVAAVWFVLSPKGTAIRKVPG